MVGEYLNHENDSYQMAGLDLHLGWHIAAHFSVHANVQLNALWLFDDDDELREEDMTDEATGRTSYMHPVVAYLRYVTPFHIYMQGGVRGDLGLTEKASGWGELGYITTFE
jgi:hypothetical protein